MWEKKKERESSPSNWGYEYKINNFKVIVIKEYDTIIEGFVYEPSGRCSNIKSPIAGTDIDLVKFKCLVKANELGWKIKSLK